MNDEKLYEHLSGFLTEERAALFDRIVLDRTRHITIVLEEIYQSQNASAVLRSCDLTGVQDVHVIENRNSYAVNKEVSMGSSKWVDIHRYNEDLNSLKKCVDQLHQKGYRIIATSPRAENSVSVQDIDVRKPMAIMFGTELDGLSEEAFELCDERMYVPMVGFTESFNISVCAAITLYTLTQRIRKQGVAFALSEEEQLELKLCWARKMLRNAKAVEERFMERSKTSH